MAEFADRVVETTQTTGTGTLDLDGAQTGFRAFSDELTTGQTVYYVIEDDPANPTEYEYGIGTWTSGAPNTLSRDTVEGSSNGGSKISLTGGTTYTVSATVTKSGLASITGIFNVVEDTTPQLGGPLDTNGQAIDESEGTPVASSATTDIWVTNGSTVHVTGVTTITSFGTAPRIGAWRKVIFDGVLILTDGANLNLPGGANITTAADDFAFVYAETTTLFKVLYFKADGTAVVVSSGVTAGTVLTQDPYTVSATVTTAHGLSSEPDFLEAVMECKTGEHNWSAGDRIDMSPHLITSAGTAGFVVAKDGTNVILITHANRPELLNKTTRALATFTAANWKLIITPYRFT